MNRPDDIPEGLWVEALESLAGGDTSDHAHWFAVEQIARAVLAERERAAKVAELTDFGSIVTGPRIAAAIRKGERL